MIFRKTITYALILCLIIILPVSMFMPKSAVASLNGTLDMVSLGDSIGYGLGASAGQGYSELFYSYLQSRPELAGIRLYNLSQPGAQSCDLLDQLKSDGILKGHLGNARVVTVSIGGNNLLEPVIWCVATAYHLDPADPKLDDKLEKAIETDKNQNNTLLRVALSETLETELNAGVTKFKENWPKVAELLKTQAPKSQIYVLTVYNPFPQDDLLFSLFDPYVQQINSTIKAGDGYTTADIYTCFLEESAQKPLNFDLFQDQIDPHPTQQGHKMISQILTTLFNLADASPWESKVGVVTNKTWTIKFNMTLADSAGKFIQVYTATGLPVNVTVKLGGVGSDSLSVFPPPNGYASGRYSLLIKDGLLSESSRKLDRSVRMDFTVE
ncbi:GDSL-type esterase/lipase family protein [Desulfosporosinus sp. BG]|uniref:SGNH/GDSL hydrolase family protein n=1 Tax=Desulfosporosinus sp. BG TaxID=1633135 RepID=UPI000839DD99|nr:GDSL-type esterase/lipase family protein [Desulfosporosinus sp. BG]ODA40804.1 Lipase/Acylhydrolase with GDSL-like motif [Desulfosporosinus sp. BG]